MAITSIFYVIRLQSADDMGNVYTLYPLYIEYTTMHPLYNENRFEINELLINFQHIMAYGRNIFRNFNKHVVFLEVKLINTEHLFL